MMNCHFIWDHMFLALAMWRICLCTGIYCAMACRFYISVTHLQAFSQKMKKRPKVLDAALYIQEIKRTCIKTLKLNQRWFLATWKMGHCCWFEINLFHFLSSTNWKKHAYLHLCRCSMSCANYILVACMVMSQAIALPLTTVLLPLGDKVGRKIWLHLGCSSHGKKNVCLFCRLYICACVGVCVLIGLLVFVLACVRIQVCVSCSWQLFFSCVTLFLL